MRMLFYRIKIKKMEKLIELLNEFEKESVVHRYERYWEDVLLCRYVKDNFEYYTDEAATIAISKYYWFIERLVQNNKIDKKKIRSPIIHYKVEEDRDGGIHYYDLDFADVKKSLLMSLAISKDPIEDLISYLK